VAFWDLIPIVSIYIIRGVPEKPLKTPWYYILLALAAGDRHGLAIAREVLGLSDGLVRLWPATLYGALEDLCDRGWIEELDEEKGRPAEESERRRYYRITRAGRAALSAETQRLAGLVRIARSRVKARHGETL
jgi:DNA-binding PadR family transcriptional regulator